MRTRVVWSLIAAIAVAALVWGWSIGGESVPARPRDQTVAVDPAWYAALPLGAEAATAAYLARIPTEMRARGEAYSDTRMLTFWLRVLTLILATAFLCVTEFAAQVRDMAARRLSRPSAIDTAVALQYFAALFALSLPVEIYARFARPHRFGFSDQPFVGWLADYFVNWGVITTFYLVAALLIYRAFRWRPAQWVGWAVAVYVVLRALYALLSPDVIEPLTNNFRPLADGPQKQQIVALAHANGIDELAVVTGDASRQSRLLNAHVSGFAGTTRISVDDNTLSTTSDPMLRAVVAHEIGHFVLKHTAASIVTDSLVMALGFAAIALCLRVVLRRFGPRLRIEGIGDIAALPVFWGLLLLWIYASLPLGNAFSRISERQADLFALGASQAPHGLAEFMIHDADTTRLSPTALEYALFYTHPSAAERVATAMRWRAETAPLRDQ
jgi:STE24 endopeptidase